MIYVPDTNVLLRFAVRADPQHTAVLSSIKQIKNGGHGIYILLQNCVEFWNVFTRPKARNGFGLTAAQADYSLRLLEKMFSLLPETGEIYDQWKRLVLDFGVFGVQVHDARIVAAMLVHRATHLLTFNTSDFNRYSKMGIVAISPKNFQ